MNRVAVVAGVGPGNGAAITRRFTEAGYAVAMLARSREALDRLERDINGARGDACDVTSPQAVAQAFSTIRADLGEVDVLVYNAGSGLFADVENITPEQFEVSWRVNAYGSLLCVQQVIPAMKAAKSGAIVFIGATASRRGGVAASCCRMAGCFPGAAPPIRSQAGRSTARSMRPRKRPGSGSGCRLIRCVTASPPICWNRMSISA